MKRILVVKTSSLGDIIHTFPVAGYLHEKFPEVEIDWVVERSNAELIEANSQITNVLQIDTRAWRKGKNLSTFFQLRKALRSKTYDVVFDLQGNIKSALFTWMARSKQKVGFGKESVPECPNLLSTNIRFNPPPHKNIREDYLSIVQQFFGDPHPYSFQGVILRAENRIEVDHPHPILVCPGSHWRNKQLPEELLLQMLQDLHRNTRCYFYFAWGTQSEKKLSERMTAEFKENASLLDRLTFPSLQHFMSQMKLVIAMDSLPLHLAATTTTPTFSIFGPSSAAKYAPEGPQHSYVQGPCPYGKTFDKRCPILRTCETGACIRSINNVHVDCKIPASAPARSPARNSSSN